MAMLVPQAGAEAEFVRRPSFATRCRAPLSGKPLLPCHNRCTSSSFCLCSLRAPLPRWIHLPWPVAVRCSSTRRLVKLSFPRWERLGWWGAHPVEVHPMSILSKSDRRHRSTGCLDSGPWSCRPPWNHWWTGGARTQNHQCCFLHVQVRPCKTINAARS
jgi:hypothetical protein